MSLEELKQQNAAEELKRAEVEPQLDEATDDEVAAVDEQDNDVNSEGSEEAERSSDEPVEPWMQSDDQTSQDSESVPLTAHIKLRSKLKGEVKEKNEELERLRAEVEALKSASSPQAISAGKPKREDFYESEDPDEAYLDALADWKNASQAKQAQIKQQQDHQARLEADVESKVEDHYRRAAKLLNEKGLDHAIYQKADNGFRQACSAIGDGDKVADLLISRLGKDSEKLVMFVGNNATRKAEFQASLTSDPSGMQSMLLLGEWRAELSSPQKRKSQAPKPAGTAKGDQAPAVTNLLRKYKEAHGKGDIQKAFDIKSEAKRNKLDVSNW